MLTVGWSIHTLKSANLLLTNRGLAWLDGFAPDDRESARRLVNGLTLVSLAAFDRTIERMVRAQANEINGPMALYAVREIVPSRSYFDQATAGRRRKSKLKGVDAVGRGPDVGSEGYVAATLRHIARSDPDRFLNHPTVTEMRDKKCRAIIVVDDLIGSGKRTREFLDAIWIDRTIRSWWSLGYIRFKVVAYAGTRAGMHRVRRATYGPTIVIDRECPTFPGLPWPAQQRKLIARLCKNYASQTSKPNMALGYRDTMASLVFEHGCPNNAPAILWASRTKTSRWRPLFPNRSVSQDERSVFPPEIARRDPISVLLDAGQPRLARTGLRSVHGEEQKRILTILALVAKGVRRSEAFSFVTGLSHTNVERTLYKCVKWRFITRTYRITAGGLAEVRHARRTGRIKPDIPKKGDEDYHPQQLREATGG